MNSPATWDIELPAVVASVDAVQDMVEAMYDSVEDDLYATDRIRFESAVVEIVANVIEHSHPVAGRDAVSMRVSITRDGNDLKALITDDGGPADVDLSRAKMTDTDEFDGRGLAMALALSTSLTYDRDGDHNRWAVTCTCG